MPTVIVLSQMLLTKLYRKTIRGLKLCSLNMKEESTYRTVVSQYHFRGYDRVYFSHVRKTGGTSINNQFLTLSDQDHKDAG